MAFSDTSSISKLLQLYQNQLQTFSDQILIPKKSLCLLLIAKLGQIIMTLGNYDLELTKDCSRNDCFWNILPYQRMMICTKSCSLDQNGITCINSLIPANTLTTAKRRAFRFLRRRSTGAASRFTSHLSTIRFTAMKSPPAASIQITSTRVRDLTVCRN